MREQWRLTLEQYGSAVQLQVLCNARGGPKRLLNQLEPAGLAEPVQPAGVVVFVDWHPLPVRPHSHAHAAKSPHEAASPEHSG